MADTAVVLNISEMIDLAIGTPEVGVVDFNMLQTVLHCLAQQQRVLGKHVEVRGSQVTLPVSRDNVQTINITEYAIDTDQTKKDVAPPPPAPPPKDETILVVERIRKSAPESTRGTPSSKESAAKIGERSAGRPASSRGPASSAASTAGGQRHGKEGREVGPRLSLVTMSKFNVLEDTVEDLKHRVFGSMPRNEDILGEVRSQLNINAISDMWTNLNISARLEAAELGIGKLSSLVQDLINEISELQTHLELPVTDFGATTGAATPGSARSGVVAALLGTPVAGAAGGPGTPRGGAPTYASVGVGSAKMPSLEGFATKEDLTNLMGHTTRLRGDLDHLSDTFYSVMKEVKPDLGANNNDNKNDEEKTTTTTIRTTITTTTTTTATKTKATTPATTTTTTAPNAPIEYLNVAHYLVLPPPPSRAPSIKELAVVPVTTGGGAQGGGSAGGAEGSGGVGGDAGGGVGSDAGGGVGGEGAGAGTPVAGPLTASSGFAAMVQKINDIEYRLRICCEDVGKYDDTAQEQIGSIQDQMDHLSKQVLDAGGPTGFSTAAARSGLSPDLIKDLQGLMQLFQTVQEMQEQLKVVHETALQLATEKEGRQSITNALLEQIELLKIVKMDREDMAEVMADKADLRMLARKVSHDQFDMACDDLSKGLEHAIGKLNMQEALWQQALDDIQREIETKLDKVELCPVKDFFNSKLKQLQEHLKQMASLRREAEAAGTKRKLLRDVNCLSCDANAVMKMDAGPSVPISKPMVSTLSNMKPYLSYELDTIRKAQASQLPQRNMHDWENIDKQMTQPKPPLQVRSGAGKHTCNRYCGGSHTTTTPAQRVARLGHFIKQWGPDVLPLSSGLAAGDDGRLYRVQTKEAASVGPAGAVDSGAPKSPPKRQSSEVPAEKAVGADCKCLEPVERSGK